MLKREKKAQSVDINGATPCPSRAERERVDEWGPVKIDWCDAIRQFMNSYLSLLRPSSRLLVIIIAVNVTWHELRRPIEASAPPPHSIFGGMMEIRIIFPNLFFLVWISRSAERWGRLARHLGRRISFPEKRENLSFECWILLKGLGHFLQSEDFVTFLA